jgi:hypothetical protein
MYRSRNISKRKSKKNKRKRSYRKHHIQGGALIKNDWPTLFPECALLNNDVNADECFRELKSAADNPYFLSDKINGYTSNGYFNGWGLKKPIGVEYITVHNSDQISRAIKYGTKLNKKIIVKNTGHDYIGRSFPDDNMLVIFTHNMNKVVWKSDKYIIDEDGIKKAVDFGTEFKKECDAQLEYNKGYCTVDAGVQWWKVFDYMNKNKNTQSENRIDVWAMKGASNTVGAAGGWIIDGGFSSFTKLFGMGIDNVLSMEVILADGKIYHISNCNHPDLFFAFRGGGACNFGIVSNVSYRLLDALTSFGDFFAKINIPNEDETLFKKVFAILLKSKILNDKHFAGTFQIFKRRIDIYISYANLEFEDIKRDYVLPFIEELAKINVIIKLQENTDISKYTGDLLYDPTYDAILSAQPNSNLHEKNKKFTESRHRWWEYESYNDFIVAFGSRYLLISDIENVEECSNKFWDILEHTNMVQLETSKGLYGADETIININKTSAVNPKVREAIGLVYIRSYLKDFMPMIDQPYEELLKITFKYENHALIFHDWSQKISELENESYMNKQKKLKAYIMAGAEKSSIRIKNAVQKLRETIGDNSTYINHSSIDEPDWGNTFWGEENFNKLIELKAKYDPHDVFKHRYSIPLR